MPSVLNRVSGQPAPSEITPRTIYEGRRGWMKRLTAGALGSGLATWAARDALATGGAAKGAALAGAKSAVAGAVTMEKSTPRADATSYNNFYEFGT